MSPLISSEQFPSCDVSNEGENHYEAALESVMQGDLQKEITSITKTFKDSPDSDLDMFDYPILKKLKYNLEIHQESLRQRSRTAKLWLQYLYCIVGYLYYYIICYIDIVKMCIRSERTGDWNLYLITLSKMLNLFAATAHVYTFKIC